MQVFTDDDADLSVVQARNVAVIGHGGEACAHGLCLRDSGVDVRIGLPADSPYHAEVEAAGLPVLQPYGACEEADLIVLVSPEPRLRSLYVEAVEPNLVPGDALVFDRGFELRFGLVTPPGDVDVVMVAPEEPGNVLREEFEAGRGAPVLVAVRQDATGEAGDLVLSYARAIGGTRTAAIATTVAEQAESALFAEQAVVYGGLTALVERGFETLVDGGCSPEVAYLRCVRDLRRAVELLVSGNGEDCDSLSDAGGSESSSGRDAVGSLIGEWMQQVLNRVRDGSWARDSVALQNAGEPANPARGSDVMEHTGRRLRELFGPQLRDF